MVFQIIGITKMRKSSQFGKRVSATT